MFEKGQKVWCVIHGAGVVEEIYGEGEETFPVVVKSKNGFTLSYTADGRYYTEGNVTLFPQLVKRPEGETP